MQWNPSPPRQTKPVKLPDWAEKSLSRLSVPVSTVNPVVTILPNGLKLIVQPESVSNTVSVYGHVKNTPDLEAPKGKEGVDQVLASFSPSVPLRWTVWHSRKPWMTSALESRRVRISSCRFWPVSSTGACKLLADNVLHPALPEGAFKTVRSQAAATAAGRLESPEYLAERALNAALLPKNDPTLREATPATVSSLTLQDVKEYYRRVFRPDLTSIVVIGKVTPEGPKR